MNTRVTYLFAIYDRIAKEFAPSFEAQNKAVADRLLANLLRDQKALPEDFELISLAKITRTDDEINVTTNYET